MECGSLLKNRYAVRGTGDEEIKMTNSGSRGTVAGNKKIKRYEASISTDFFKPDQPDSIQPAGHD